jgi:mono/diheme cytochrome c family protein
MHIGNIMSSALAVIIGCTLVVGGSTHGEEGGHPHTTSTLMQEHAQGSVRISDAELHQHGGVPPGWRFAFPAGDPKAGRAVFAKLECYQCHTIRGEQFPQASTQPSSSAGPELTGMGSHHPAEYFAESILNPNAVIVTGPGYTGPDGLSIMPDYRESLTVAELVDLVAFLKSLQEEHSHPEAMEHHGGYGQTPSVSPQEALVGNYRIRLVSLESHDSGHGHGGPMGGTPSAHAHPHLMAFITDVKTGEAVPYLPVTATIHAATKPARTVKLAPVLGEEGFHYGADLPLSAKTTKVSLAIGATTMKVIPSANRDYSKPQAVTFTWEGQQPTTHGSSAQDYDGHGHAGEHSGH